MTYEELLADYEGVVKIKEADFSKKDFLKGLSGLYKNGNIVVDSNLKLDKEKKCVLVEELGHHFTSFGNILDNKDIINIKQEKIARNWGYEKLVGIRHLIEAYDHGCRTAHEIAEYLDVTQDFFEEAIQHYKEKYEMLVEIDNYIVYFEPRLGILKMF